MRKIYKVARREYLETVKTKTFILSLVFVPALIVIVILISSRLARSAGGPREPVRVSVTCASVELMEKVRASFDVYDREHAQSRIVLEPLAPDADGAATEEEGKERLRGGTLDAYVVLAGDLETPAGEIRLYTYKPKPWQVEALLTMEGLLRNAVVDRRYDARGIDRKLLEGIGNVPFKRLELGDSGNEEHEQKQGHQLARMMVPFAFMYLIFMGIAGSGHHMLTSIIEEKNSRIIEVLLAAISPLKLMAGKILGLAVVGFTVTVFWGGAAYLAARSHGLRIDIGGDLIGLFLLYYILGFFLYTGILAAVGSVCNTLKETQSLMMPIMIVFVIPLVCWLRLVQEPNGLLARVLSFIPPATPMVMLLRLSSGTEIWTGEVVLTLTVLAASVLVTVWIAAKVFRTGILLYGKRPGAREILRWLRQN
jgi:ABC-2 type transport system permease protein